MENFEKTATDRPKIKAQLDNAGIDISVWGTGGYKKFEDLVKEIDSQEIILINNEKGELIRISEVVAATILFVDNDEKRYRLKEEKQVFIDGRERVRPSNGQSVFEKMKLGENPAESIIRGISEELGINGDIDLNYINKAEGIADSKSYPGLLTKSTTHFFEVVLTPEQFNLQGYLEEQPDKITYFVWEQVNN